MIDALWSIFKGMMFALFCWCVILIGFTAGDRRLPVVIYGKKVLNPSVKAGENVLVELTFLVREHCPTHIDHYFIDKDQKQITLPPIDRETGNAPVGVVTTLIVQIPVPAFMPGGPTLYRATSINRCNVIQRMWPLYPPPFEVAFFTQAVSEQELQQRISRELRDLLQETLP